MRYKTWNVGFPTVLRAGCGLGFVVASLVSNSQTSVASDYSTSTSSSVEVIQHAYQNRTLVEEQYLVDLVTGFLELDHPDGPFLNAQILTVLDEDRELDYLVVYLGRRDSFVLEIYKITLAADGSIISIVAGYEPSQADSRQTAGFHAKAQCPDETVRAVFGTFTTEFKSSKEGVRAAAAAAEQSGYKSVVLMGNKASVSAYKNWLSCRNLRLFGNIGHGHPSGIMLSGGRLSSDYFNDLDNQALKPIVLYFNSCQVHNDPLESAILGAGASRFIGGNVNLRVGPSEEVFKCFWAKAFETKGAMEPILEKCEDKEYVESNAHGISGDGPLPWGVAGSPCADESLCDSGQCIDGVCCETICDGCMVCDALSSLGMCAPTPDGTPCLDADLCNGSEQCQAGACGPGEPLVCVDDNACTDDACDPTMGCVYENLANGSPCNNDTVCDGEETCENGTCAPGEPLNCDDQLACTDDSCDPVDGCVYATVADGTDCSSDECGEASCDGGNCFSKSSESRCDDGNRCTADSCEPGKGCINLSYEDGYQCAGCGVCIAGAIEGIPGCVEQYHGVGSCAAYHVVDTQTLVALLLVILSCRMQRRCRKRGGLESCSKTQPT